MTVPYTFANASGNIALSELDVNFANVKAAADTAGTVTTNAQPNITSVGILTSLSVSGNINGGNISGNIVGSISNAVYANTAGRATTANTVTVNAQPNITSVGTLTDLSVSGTVTTGNLTVSGTIAGIVNSAVYADEAGNADAAIVVTGNNQPNITNVGTLYDLNVYTTVNSGNVLTGGVVSAAGNVRGANFNTVGLVTATGNVIGGNLISNGTLSVAGNVSISGITTLSSSNASSIQTVVGVVGAIVAITDSPGNGGQLAYWDTTNSRWSYVFDNSAV